MKKILAIFCVLVLAVVVTGCGKSNDGDGLVQSDSDVKAAVKGWVVYTNPAYRYELRFPQDWSFKDSGEDGKSADFMPAGTGVSQMTIKSYSNWSEKFNLEQFYKNKQQKFFEEMKKENVDIGGFTGSLIRGVTGRIDGAPEKTVDLIALDLGDRIIEIELRENNETVKMILSSIKFYGNSVISDIK